MHTTTPNIHRLRKQAFRTEENIREDTVMGPQTLEGEAMQECLTLVDAEKET